MGAYLEERSIQVRLLYLILGMSYWFGVAYYFLQNVKYIRR